MRKSLSLIIVILLINITVLYGQTLDIIAIENVNVIPMTEEKVIPNQRVLISGGKILKIEPASNPLSYQVSQTIDGNGNYLLPGFSEMHYHARGDHMVNDLKLLVANGITTVRNMAELPGQDQVARRQKALSGEIIAPHYFTTGPYLRAEQLRTTDEVMKVVQMHKEKGYDFLKLADNLPKDIYLKLLEECNKNKLPIIGHAQRNLPLEYSLRMKSIEHIEEFVYLTDETTHTNFLKFSKEELQKLAEKLRKGGLYIGTTLSVFDFILRCLNDESFALLQKDELVKYLAKEERENFLTEKNDYRKLKNSIFDGKKSIDLFTEYFTWMKQFAGILAQSGVYLLSGSDTYGMVIIGFSLHKEFELLQQAGVKPYDILLSTTVYPARYLNTYSMEGTVVEGKNANLVLLAKNPLEDIRNTRTIEGVMLKGKWIDRTAINTLLKEVEEEYK